MGFALIIASYFSVAFVQTAIYISKKLLVKSKTYIYITYYNKPFGTRKQPSQLKDFLLSLLFIFNAKHFEYIICIMKIVFIATH